MRKKVLLPEPLRPKSAMNSSGRIVTSNPRSTSRPWKDRLMSWVTTAACCTSRTAWSRTGKPSPPDEQPPFEETDEVVGDETQEGIDHEAEHDDVGPVPRLGLVDQVAESTLGVDLLGHDDDQPAPDDREPQSDEEAGQRAGDDHTPDEPGATQAERLAGLHEARVHGTDRAVGVDVHGERDAERDEEDLRRLTDPEPDDDERDEPEDRDRAEHLHRRVEKIIASSGQAREHREREARGHADDQPDRDTLERDEQVLLELARRPQL